MLLVKIGFTQPLRSFDVDSSFSGKQLILVSGIVDYSASTMRNAVLSPLIFGGFIDSAAKANSRHDKPFNSVGFEGNATYAHYFSIKDNDGFPARWMLGPTVGTHYVGALRYTSDLYTLAFYGN